MTRHLIALCSIAAALILLCPISALPQVAIGTPPFGSFSGGPDIVDNANLNIHYTIPVLRKTGRGTDFNYNLTYDSSVWERVASGSTFVWQPVVSSKTNWGWQGLAGEPYMGYSMTYTSGMCYDTGWQPYQEWSFSNFYYYDPSGFFHNFGGSFQYYKSPGQQGCPANGPPPPPITDGLGFTLYLTIGPGSAHGYLIDKQGNIIYPPFVSNPSSSTTDRNGNEITSLNNSSFTDTLGMNVLNVSGAAPSNTNLSYTAPSGATATYVVSYKTRTVRTNFGCSGITDYPPTNVSLVDRVTLPDQSYFQFQYEPTPGYSGDFTGRVASVTLPTGGTISYLYTGANNGIVCADGSAAGLTRTTPYGSWQYSRALGSGAASTTTITDPMENQVVINFQGIYLTERQDYAGTSSLLQTETICYNGNTTNCNSTAVSSPITQRSLTIQLPGSSNLECQHAYQYDNYGNTTELDDYDYGVGMVGRLIRKETIAYFYGGNINTFRQLDTIFDGSGNTVSKTVSNYDETQPIATSGTPQHVSVTGPRANLTSVDSYTQGSTFLKKTLTYYDTGNLYTVTDVNGALATVSYGTGSCGNSFPTGVSLPLGLSRTYAWNCTGGVQTSLTDENAKTSTISFTDGYFWRSASVTGPTNAVANKSYLSVTQTESSLSFNAGLSAVDNVTTVDGLGRPHVLQKRQAPGGTNFDSVETDYDSVGRVDRVTLSYLGTIGQTSSSAPAVTTTYDTLNRPLSLADSGSGSTTFSYSQNDELRTVGPAPTGESTKRKQYEYDALGRLTSVCEITNGTSAWPGGSCAQTTPQTGYWTQYTYNVLNNLTVVIQNAQSTSNKQTRTYNYDYLGRTTSETNPESGATATTYTYDTDSTCGTSKGDLVKTVDQVGNTTCYAYDALHRPTSVTYPSGSYSSVTPSRYLVYDSAMVNSVVMSYAKGRMAEAYTCFSPCTSKITDEGFSYTARGEVSDVYESTLNSGGYYHVNETHWANGAINTFSGVPSLPTITYGLDGEGRVNSASASSGQNPLAGVTYNTASQITGLTLGSLDSDSFSFDPNTSRMSQYQFNVNGQSVVGKLTWNSIGTLASLAITDPFNSSNAQTCNYTHDDLSRIAADNCGSNWSQTFSYDSFGNISKSGTQSFQPTYSSTTNQITSVGSCSASYDSDGNVLKDCTNTYAWDSNARPVTINGLGITYDALGRMVERNNAGSITQVVYAPGGNKLAIMNGQTLIRGYLPLTGSAMAEYQPNGALYYRHSDWLGSARLVSSTSRTVYFDGAYGPFGEQYAQSGTTDVMFTGMNQDTYGNIYDFPGREYAIQGRWPSPDPAGLGGVSLTDPQTFNRYGYVRNSPLGTTDPTGRCDWLLSLLNISDCDGPDGDNDSDDRVINLKGFQINPGIQICSTGPISVLGYPEYTTAKTCVALLGPPEWMLASANDGQDLVLDLGANSGILGGAAASVIFPAQAGRAFQQTFNETFNVEEGQFKIGNELGNSRPDLMSDSGDVMVGEIKSGQYIYMTNQLQIQEAYAIENDLPFYVVVSPNSEVAGTVVLSTEATGGAVFTFNPATGALVQLTIMDGQVVVAEAAVSEATVEEFVALLLLLGG